jgi:hypothetical protein
VVQFTKPGVRIYSTIDQQAQVGDAGSAQASGKLSLLIEAARAELAPAAQIPMAAVGLPGTESSVQPALRDLQPPPTRKCLHFVHQVLREAPSLGTE